MRGTAPPFVGLPSASLGDSRSVIGQDANVPAGLLADAARGQLVELGEPVLEAADVGILGSEIDGAL
jgi:hypothetical protein